LNKNSEELKGDIGNVELRIEAQIKEIINAKKEFQLANQTLSL
jgi:hypothetical protein